MISTPYVQSIPAVLHTYLVNIIARPTPDLTARRANNAVKGGALAGYHLEKRVCVAAPVPRRRWL